MSQSAENDVPLTLDEISDLLGDDIAYWMRNPFMDREALIGKVEWWINRAIRVIPPAKG